MILSTLFSDPSAVDRLLLSPLYLFGVLLLAIGAAMRQVCYDALGRFFTFQLAVFKEHKLVTSGPYSIVRHPSYTALLIARTGLFMCRSSQDPTYSRADYWTPDGRRSR